MTIDSFERSAAGEMIIHWTGWPGSRYQVQYSQTLNTANWLNLGAQQTVSNAHTPMQYSVIPVTGAGQCFYRVARLIRGDSPIAVAGFNRDVVVERTASGGDTTLYAQTFDTASSFTFYEAGLNGISHPGGGVSSKGLPQSGLVVSAFDGLTSFQLAPYSASNVLYLNQTSPSGTLNVAVPAAYNFLSILATSAEGGGGGSFVIRFADNSTSPPINFAAPDWYDNPGAASSNLGRIYAGNYGQFLTADADGNNPNLYQTTVNLGALGLDTKPIAAITFTMPSGAGTSGNTVTAVFAVSGTPE